MADNPEQVILTIEEKKAHGKELFGRGSRNYCVKSYAEAADDLSEVCEIYAEVYGQKSEELGMPYLLYAKSLIAVAQDENKVMNNVPEENEEGEDDDDDDEEEEEEDGVEENGEKDEVKPENGTEKTNGHSVEEAGPSGEQKPDDMAETDSKGAADEEEDDAAATLQVAWEVLELAAIIFTKQGEAGYTNLADTYLELASISFENSNFELAVKDYEKSIEIYNELPVLQRRILAEIHFKIGLSHLMLNGYEPSLISFKKAVDLLNDEIDEAKSKDPQTDEIKNKIIDMEEIKEGITGKIIEVEECKETPIEEVKQELAKVLATPEKSNPNAAGPSAGSSGSSSSSAPKATDISHLIKRKRPDTIVEPESSPAKRSAP